ncbi:putative U box domain, armadillo-like helical, Zinc finger, RING/FYVE/PHD-type [Dioscorea sansibarensis]
MASAAADAAELLDLARAAPSACPRAAQFRPDCARLARKVSVLANLFEEILDFFVAAANPPVPPVDQSSCCLDRLLLALRAVLRFFSVVDSRSGLVGKLITIQFQYVIWQLESALGKIPFNHFNISDEVQEQVELVRLQLRRSLEKPETPNLTVFSEVFQALSDIHVIKDVYQESSNKSAALEIGGTGHSDHDIREVIVLVAEVNGKSNYDVDLILATVIQRLGKTKLEDLCKVVLKDKEPDNSSKQILDEIKKADTPVIPEDFRCPISLELMKDPVIVATGQTYERSFIQRWIDCGNRTCPKTQQRLQNLTLTPNYVLRSLIMQWCEFHRIEQPNRLINGRLRKKDGTFYEISGDRAAIDTLVRKLSGASMEEQRSAAAEIRSLAKRSTDNRILIAEAGAVQVLIGLLSANDQKTQEHAVTSLLNLSIYEPNRETIMLAGGIVPIIEVLRMGSMEARENAAAAVFSLSLSDENKITIGGTAGAIEALVELLQCGSSRGKKDAATALFNLCIYQGNKSRAVKAGILKPLLDMLKDCSSNGMVDESLTILSVLVSHQEAKLAIAKSNMIPHLIDLLRTGQPRSKENAAAVLLALCKKNCDNLACIGRLGAVIPLTELATSGTERAKRKAISLLEHLNKLRTILL